MQFSNFLKKLKEPLVENQKTEVAEEKEIKETNHKTTIVSLPSKSISKERKAIKFISNRIDDGITIVFILLLLIGVYFIYDSAYVFYNNSAAKVKAYKPDVINAETLLQVGEDCVAWITIDNSDIDYPIMQGKDNAEYLNKAPDGSYSLAGSIFLDSRNKKDFSDDYSLIYGHNLSNREMLGALVSWEDEKYFKEHLVGTLIVGDVEYEYNVFAYAMVDTSDDVIFDPHFGNPMNFIKSKAINYVEPKDGKLVVLSTCKSPTSTLRNILCGTIKKKGSN